MVFNLLFLPLLGGFIFIRHCRLTRYYTLRSEGYVLLFYSATAAVFFSITATLITFHAEPSYPNFNIWWHQIIPFEHSGKAVFAFALGVVLWPIINIFSDDTTQAYRAIKRRRNPLEVLFMNAMENSQLVAMSLKNKKVYVGYVVSMSNPAFPLESVAISPMMSGFRNDADQTVRFTTPYIDAYDQIKTATAERVGKEAAADPDMHEQEIQTWIEEETTKAVNSFRHIIMVREIDTAFPFQLDIYELYFGAHIKAGPN